MAKLDYSLFRFPSDEVTIGKLRSFRNNPDLFYEGEKLEKPEESALNLMQKMLHAERRVALLALERHESPSEARSIEATIARHETIYDLEKLYKIFGLSRGSRETERLVKKIEQTAIAQAPSGRTTERSRTR